ncbi:MAG: tyrosine-type recombinase/integrase [Gammaproteobacteria bacterium]
MGRRKTPGLVQRNGIWHIDKTINGQRICESCGTSDAAEAERYLARKMEELRQASVYGVRPKRTFDAAAAKFVLENQHKRSIECDIGRLKGLMPWLGNATLDRIHMGTLQPWIDARRREGRRPATINQGLAVVRRIVNLAATEWVDEHGLTWLAHAPKIRLLPDPASGKRQPYPLTWEEQHRLFKALPTHLAEMALFAVNTGCRDAEVCHLQWQWEQAIPALGTSVFLIPGAYVKNSDDRLVILNRVARSIVEARRGKHPTHVFSYRGQPMTRMLNSAWCAARQRVGLTQVRVHDLKHTFAARLRNAGVGFEDLQDLLGHRNRSITLHYAVSDLVRLQEAANRACEAGASQKPMVLLRRNAGAATANHAKITQAETAGSREVS